MDDRRWTMDDRRWMMDDGRWTEVERRLGFFIPTSNLQLSTCNLQPATCNLQPSTCPSLMDSISKLTYRRFLLGSQGLWPGRRYRGLIGAESALKRMQALQLDPLVMVARSQDIAMYGRVLDYKPDLLYKMAYEKRKAFDYGGWLMMYPMHEFPYWRLPETPAGKRLALGAFYAPAEGLDQIRAERTTREGPAGQPRHRRRRC
ncbi:MAG: hypothetical protein L6Q45_02995 [Anaerolineales bacterium]|nr:hypothetical protein [Anaerolineales bacterium]